ncbi:MAG: secondary thiamine-phosphate synthase enzyme YjbQ [Gammaproteobacteria bacterium]|nr:secondary thiamine-phosphate synthase enzyme YjbQ [Gammaproteobacteria bacterium]MDH5734656.1 secondary thiamine-phosphate synthase enzyme YjbQ [Gammaproteobacteria bacterium]
MVFQQKIKISTLGRGTSNITRQVNELIQQSGITQGIVNIFVHHTSASLILCENADPTVRSDLEAFMEKITPDGDTLYRHIDEGPDDMSAHVRTVLTDSSLSIPLNHRQCLLGTWQGIYLWEHRTHPHNRSLTITVYGE